MQNQLEQIIGKLISVRKQRPGTSAGLSSAEIIWLCQTVRKIFLDQPILLELQPPITICGDTHGQYHDVLRLFQSCKFPPHTNYLFLGDYVDRGCQSIETVCLLFAFKIRYPENFFLLRGNHECSYINRQFGFFDECTQYYNTNIWKIFCDVFNCLPVAAIIEDKIFCVHGGISPSLTSLDQIRTLPRPSEVPEDGILCDLLWADPCNEIDDWDENDRGTSYIFGPRPLQKFLRKFKFELVCRAHQAVMGGYDFPFDSNQSIVTVFSAPNYCYEFGNKGAVLKVDENLYCNFVVLDPVKWEDEFFIEGRPGTPPRGTIPTLSEIQLT